MNLKQYFTPQVRQKLSSPLNPQIEIISFGGHPRMDIGGLTQSGRIIEQIWHTAFQKLLPRDFSPTSVLILGFGAGSAAKLVSRRWSQAAITGVEIDPLIIAAGKKYFRTDEIKSLNLVNADAVEFVTKNKNQHWDLSLVDCYLGDQIPTKLESPAFYKKLSRLCDHILINRLFWGEYQKPTIGFLTRLEHHFALTHTRTPSNFIIHLSPISPTSTR